MLLIGRLDHLSAFLKPARIRTRFQQAMPHSRNDRYYLRFDLGKSNAGEANQSPRQPIPVISAQAIRMHKSSGRHDLAFGETVPKRALYVFSTLQPA